MDMEKNTSAVERAFQLAKCGKFEHVSSVKLALVREGYLANQISGPILKRKLHAELKKWR